MNKLSRLLAVLLLCAAGTASAFSVTFTANDLADVNPGEDLWEYRYTFDGNFALFDTVEIAFDSGLYTALDGDSVVGDWSISIVQPDPVLGADGLYSALATVSPISVADEFVLRFVWLGGDARPGAQSYRVLDEILEEKGVGRTQSSRSLPEPGSVLLLMAAGVALMGALRHRKRDQ